MVIRNFSIPGVLEVRLNLTLTERLKTLSGVFWNSYAFVINAYNIFV